MDKLYKKLTALFLLLVAVLFSNNAKAQVDPALLTGLKYRMIGPHRGGELSASLG